MMAYCPNCSAELPSLESLVCENCQASFSAPDGWRPTERPVGKFVARVKQVHPTEPITVEAKAPSSSTSKVLRSILATPLFIVCAALMWLVPSTSGGTLFPAMFFAGAALFVLLSRSKIATGVSVVAGIAMLLVVWLILAFVGAAISSK